MVFSPCIKFRANICRSGRDIAIKPLSKWQPPPSWNFSEVKYELNFVSGTLFLVSSPNFVKNMCNSDRVMAVKVNFKMAVAAILDFAGIEF